MRPEPDRLTVYYDGACPLCTAEIRHYAAQDRENRICFVDANDLECSPGSDLDRDRALARFHVRRADGTLVSGAAGFAEIWQVLPAWRWAARLTRLPGALRLLELAYRAFLPLRPWLARRLGPIFARREGRER